MITLLTDVLFCVFYVVENILSTNMPPPVSVPTLPYPLLLHFLTAAAAVTLTSAPHVSADRGDPPALFIARATWLYAVLQALVALSTLGFLASTRAAASAHVEDAIGRSHALSGVVSMNGGAVRAADAGISVRARMSHPCLPSQCY